MQTARKISVSFQENELESIELFAMYNGIKTRNDDPNRSAAIRQLVRFVLEDLAKIPDVQEIMNTEGSTNILYFLERAVRGYAKSRRRKEEDEGS